MAQRKADIARRLIVRRGLGEAEAALYVGLGATKFRELVKDGRMPKPRMIDGARVFDIYMLDAAFSSLPIESEHGNVERPRVDDNPWHSLNVDREPR